jgi:outer membrane protein
MTSKSFKSFVVAAAAAVLAMGAAQAQELKIGYVNSERVLRDAAPAKAALARMVAAICSASAASFRKT